MKKLYSALIFAVLALSLSGCSDSAEQTVTTTTYAETTTTAAETTTTTAVTTTPETTAATTVRTTSEYEKFSSKDNAMSDDDGFTELFWNVSENGDAGFAVPMERYCSDHEFYLTAEELISGGRGFFSAMTTGIEFLDAPDAITSDTDENAYYTVNPECVYGCTTTNELYDKYCEFFVGDIGYDGFYSGIGQYFTDVEGRLSATIMAQGFMGGGFLEWGRSKTLIYDKTDEAAEVIIAVPETILNDDPRDYEIYTFFHVSLVNTENGWRLTDDAYYNLH